MDESFDLLSSMSPKFDEFAKPTRRKNAPTFLSLKRNIRRSSQHFQSNKCTNDSVIIIESSSSSSSESPVFISDSENSTMAQTPPRPRKFQSPMTKEKLTNIETWLNGVNSARDGKIIIEDDVTLEAQFDKITLNSEDCTSLLDDLYGSSWREQTNVLPSSEPRRKKTQIHINKKSPPKTEKPKKVQDSSSSNNLLKTLQKTRIKKALEVPWLKTINQLCDPDTDSGGEDECLQPIKLHFEDDEEENNENVNVKSKSKSQNNNKLTKIIIGNDNEASLSFLASLSKTVPIAKCNMSALIYRNNFQTHRERLVKKLFTLYNERIFDNTIPVDSPIEWSDRMRGTAGFCYCRKVTRSTGVIERKIRIVLAKKVLDSADRVRDTLVHEMCHAATWIVNHVADGHGSLWQAWADRAMNVFPELPPIKRCHNYVINTKYTYRCMGCGYSVGRHTKSLNIEIKRCGYCYGKFEVFINKTNKKGETKSMPVTPKKTPSAFALFVKENYATYKIPQRNHGDVMRILGEKFAEFKLDKS